MYKAIREQREAKSVKIRGKTLIVDISSTVQQVTTKLVLWLETVVPYRTSQQRAKSVTISGLWTLPHENL